MFGAKPVKFVLLFSSFLTGSAPVVVLPVTCCKDVTGLLTGRYWLLTVAAAVLYLVFLTRFHNLTGHTNTTIERI